MEHLQNFLADLHVLNVKFHNLHWNVTGKQFIALHEFTEAAYDEFFEQFDEVAEAMKMRGVYPLASVSDYLKHTTVKELKSKDYSIDEVLAILKEDFKALKESATFIRNEADEANDFTLVAQFEDYIQLYDKHIWFVSALAA